MDAKHMRVALLEREKNFNEAKINTDDVFIESTWHALSLRLCVNIFMIT